MKVGDIVSWERPFTEEDTRLFNKVSGDEGVHDFRQSREFAEYVLQRRLPRKKGPKSTLIHLAFSTSRIISDSRPFTGNKNADGKTEPLALKQQISELLNEEERKLHDKVVGRRNSTYAHSDARMHLIPGYDYGSRSFQLMVDPFYSLLTESETAMLRVMIGKWIRYLLKERAELKAAKANSVR
jgi:hypothetical protein